MNDIIIYGAGGFGREIALMLRQINEIAPVWNIVGFCDDGKNKSDVIDDLPVIGGLLELNAYHKPVAVALAIAAPNIRKQIRNSIYNDNITFPVLMHPSVMAGDSKRVSLGEGTIICAGTILTTNIRVGSFVIINLLCTVGHDVVIGDYCSIMPGCSLSGFDTLGAEVLLGTGARILPQLVIGNKSRVGAGAVVVEGVSEGTTVAGVPARVIAA